MNDDLTVTLTRAELHAVTTAIAGTELTTNTYKRFPTLQRDDLRAALRKLERASCGLAVVK